MAEDEKDKSAENETKVSSSTELHKMDIFQLDNNQGPIHARPKTPHHTMSIRILF